MKTKNDDISMVPNHIEDCDLISFLDGEVATDSLTEMQAHLESCWHCRSHLIGIERSIENFLQLRQEVLLPTDLPPSIPAHELFRERLAAHQSLSPSDSMIRLKSSVFRDLYRRISNLINIANHSARTRKLITRAAAAIVLVSVIAGLMFLSDRFNTVSAGELLELSINSQAEQLQGTDQPVVHQKIQVKNKNQNSAEATPITWEIWNDTVNSRIKFATYEDQSAPNARSARIFGLENILRTNRMNEQRPLSAASYKAWTDGLRSKTEEVSEGTTVNGLETLIIKTVALEPVAMGELLEARLTVRAADYHPTDLYLRAKTDDGEEVFELIERDFEVVSLKNIDPTIFVQGLTIETASTSVNASHVSSAENPSGLPEDTHTETADAETPIMSAATDAAEIEVLDLLHKAGADITEQLNVSRTATGRLMVEGLVETDNRKREILQVLAPVTKNKAIKIKIQTIKEATLALEKQKQQSRFATIDRIEVQKGTLPVDSELREYFSRKGGDIDSEIRQFASRVINRSQSAAFQASALNRLANRFTLDQLNKLEPAARAKWLNLLKGYALAVRRETASLRGELQPVFGGTSEGSGSESVTDDADLIRSSRRLYDLAAANDRVIRSAFSLASGNMSSSAIKTAQFRRSLSSAESLAAAIERAR